MFRQFSPTLSMSLQRAVVVSMSHLPRQYLLPSPQHRENLELFFGTAQFPGQQFPCRERAQEVVYVALCELTDVLPLFSISMKSVDLDINSLNAEASLSSEK